MTANKDSPVKLQEEFTGVVARAVVESSRDIESLPLSLQGCCATETDLGV